tara:strand:- start:3977 stop:4339 length:363 start_codon:yes stop_codon:yes gene_type:complete
MTNETATAIEAATRHFRSKVDQTSLKKVKVPEWGIDVYYKTAISWKQQAEIMDKLAEKKTSEALIETVVLRCLNEDGSRMFSTADRTTLINEVDPMVLVELVTKINNDSGESVKDVKKKS